MTTIYSSEYQSSVQKELSRIQKLQEVLAKEVERLQTICGLFHTETPKKISKKVQKTPAKKPEKISHSAQLRGAIVDVLQQAKRPLANREIQEAIRKGYPKLKVNTKNVSSTIGIHRDTLFESPEPGKYSLRTT